MFDGKHTSAIGKVSRSLAFGTILTFGNNGTIPIAPDNRLTFPVDSGVWSFMLKNAANGG
jgi:hypothetical protein